MAACFTVEWLRGVFHFEWSRSSISDCTLTGRHILSTRPSVLLRVQVVPRNESGLQILLVIRVPYGRGTRKDLRSNRCRHYT